MAQISTQQIQSVFAQRPEKNNQNNDQNDLYKEQNQIQQNNETNAIAPVLSVENADDGNKIQQSRQND